MPLALFIICLAMFVWWGVFAFRGSLVIGCTLCVAVGYVLGPELSSVELGPITLTADRALLAALAAAFVVQWRAGMTRPRAMTGTDWLLLALIAYLTIRCAVTPPPEVARTGAGPWWRLATAFWAPAVIYGIASMARCGQRTWQGMLVILSALGSYLAATALAEVSGQWWAVFPRYIADPDLGTHFGRARGPALMSASLGVFLTVCGWAAWMLWPRVGKSSRVLLGFSMALMAAGVFFTYTRSTWMGLAAGAAVVPMLQLPRPWRRIAATALVAAGLLAALTVGGRVVDLGRQDADGSAEHSVYQRASFVYVSLRMFGDAPLFGCGFSRFYDRKLPYLADRSQQLELESLRYLDHHNTFLSLLTETGLLGLSLFVSLLVAWGRRSWGMWRNATHPSWVRAQGALSLGALIAYVATAAFHDLSLSPTEHWLLLLITGVSSGVAAQSGVAAAADVATKSSFRWALRSPQPA